MMLTRAYYLLKPAIPRRLRTVIRRVVAKRRRRRYGNSWPINQLAGRMPNGFPGWPNGKDFAFVLTHDVEGKRGLEQCSALAALEMRMGFRSSFNFVPEGEYKTPDALREWLATNGFEVGVHDLHHSGKLYWSHKGFRRDAQKINHYLAKWQAVGFRSGFMFHNLRWLEHLNILYDASNFDTDPFEPQNDGANTIFPFWVGEGDRRGYVELPYTLPQDSTLFLVLQESSIDIWKRKLDWIAERGGMALLNVHPDYMNFDGCRGVLEYSSRLYEEFLDYVVQRYGNRYWAALPRDVATYVSRHRALASNRPSFTVPTHGRLQGKRVAMVTFSRFPEDPRPRRAAETLVQEGMTVDMICLRGDDKPPRREVLNGIDVLRIPIKHRRETWVRYAYEYSAFILIAFLTLALRSLTRGYDLIYIHNMPDILIFSSLVPKVSGAKVLLDLHDPMPELMETISKLRHDSLTVRFLKRLEKWSIGYADLVVTVNLACKRIFSSRSCRPGKIGVVMNAPDEEIFALRKTCPEGSATRVPTEPFVIMYHGTLVERNGLDLAFEALTKVRNAIPSVELRVYGVKTPYLERLLDSAGTNSVHTAIRYLGPRRLEDLVHEIEECHVGIIPNHRNCFTQINTPVRIFEYLALGKPVIAPSAPGIQDYFERESLIFFELGNAEDLARQIEYVYAHPAETVEIVKRGQQVYRAHAWRNQRQTLVDLIGELL